MKNREDFLENFVIIYQKIAQKAIFWANPAGQSQRQ